MFALEITFSDGVSESESVLIRRPHALIGASDYAHVVVDDMRSIGYQIRISREVGRKFQCRAVSSDGSSVQNDFNGAYEGEASIDTGPVKLHVTALDFDLQMKDGEAPDSAGVRVLRQALSHKSPVFPAVIVNGAQPLAVSFSEGQPIYVGRSKICALRLDASDISAKHARIGYEAGSFWIEDLGSTNGTFANGQQIAGRVNISEGTPIVLGREISISCVTSLDQIASSKAAPDSAAPAKAPQGRRYPVLVSTSEVARPARLIITPGATLNIGRDPSSEMWLGAPHVSRRHLSLAVSQKGEITVTDSSTNGTGYDGGILHKGESLRLENSPQIFDVGGGVTVAICFDEEQERQFLSANGSISAFSSAQASQATLGVTESAEIESSIELRPDFAATRRKPGFFAWLGAYFRSRGIIGLVQLVCSLLALMLVLVFVFNTVVRLLPH